MCFALQGMVQVFGNQLAGTEHIILCEALVYLPTLGRSLVEAHCSNHCRQNSNLNSNIHDFATLFTFNNSNPLQNFKTCKIFVNMEWFETLLQVWVSVPSTE